MLLYLVISGAATTAAGVGIALLYLKFPSEGVIGAGTAVAAVGVLLLLFGCLCAPRGCRSDADCIHGACAEDGKCDCAQGWTGHDCTTRLPSSSS